MLHHILLFVCDFEHFYWVFSVKYICYDVAIGNHAYISEGFAKFVNF